MKKLALLFVGSLLAVACGSPPASNTASKSTATNANANISTSSLNENAYTSFSNSELGSLAPSGKTAKEIVGKTATEVKLWQSKVVDTRLKELMGGDYATMKKSWKTETPIKKFGDFLMMTGCEEHNCANNRYVIFMDMGEGKINVIHIGKDATREWNGYGEIDLPPPFADELAAIKSRK